MKISYKVTEQIEELVQIVELQHKVWGSSVITSMPQMVAANHNGGVVIGAFDGAKVVGFCYGFPGVDEKGNKHLCSHMMGILPDYRNMGIGQKLKFMQREWAVQYGYEKMIWTFDPLEIRNGYLNLCKLGGYVQTYIESYYGIINDKLNNGLPSDRFLVEWDLNSKRAKVADTGKTIIKSEWNDYQVLFDWEEVENGIKPVQLDREFKEDQYLVPIPKEIQHMKSQNMNLVKHWRMLIREKMSEAFSCGYCVIGIVKSNSPVNYYVIEGTHGKDELKNYVQ